MIGSLTVPEAAADEPPARNAGSAAALQSPELEIVAEAGDGEADRAGSAGAVFDDNRLTDLLPQQGAAAPLPVARSPT